MFLKMKKFFVINIHSFVDVITNSSSELFVLDASYKKSIETVREILEVMLKHWNEMAIAGIFGDHYVTNKRYSFSGNTNKKPILNFDDVFGHIYVYTKEMYDSRDKEYNNRYANIENIGCIIIESQYDNSIPNQMFDWIESAFGYVPQRIHLG